MSDHIYLEGSEKVGRAGAAICAAVFNMQSAANTIDSSIAALIQHQNDMITRFENVVEKLISAVQGSRVSEPVSADSQSRRPSRFDPSGHATEKQRGRVPPVDAGDVVGKSRFEDETA